MGPHQDHASVAVSHWRRAAPSRPFGRLTLAFLRGHAVPTLLRSGPRRRCSDTMRGSSWAARSRCRH